MGRVVSPDPYNPSFDWEAENDREFGEWLTLRRKKVNMSLQEASTQARIKYSRLSELEKGDADKGITRSEALALAKVYKVDPRAIMLRAISSL
jgi:transcriptional regulator with XRE-family HTH domain